VVDYSFLMNHWANRVAVFFIRFAMRLTKSDRIICRGCGESIAIDAVPLFVVTGCSECGSDKLCMVKHT